MYTILCFQEFSSRKIHADNIDEQNIITSFAKRAAQALCKFHQISSRNGRHFLNGRKLNKILYLLYYNIL